MQMFRWPLTVVSIFVLCACIPQAYSEAWETGVFESPWTLIEESSSYEYQPASISGSDQSGVWIVSSDGDDNWGEIDMPRYRYARVLIIPYTSGQLTLEEQCPDGDTEYHSLGYVQANHQYRLWFYADTVGGYQLRCQISGGPYSDAITFNVHSSGVSDWSTSNRYPSNWYTSGWYTILDRPNNHPRDIPDNTPSGPDRHDDHPDDDHPGDDHPDDDHPGGGHPGSP